MQNPSYCPTTTLPNLYSELAEGSAGMGTEEEEEEEGEVSAGGSKPVDSGSLPHGSPSTRPWSQMERKAWSRWSIAPKRIG